jgi:hypothetical protein
MTIKIILLKELSGIYQLNTPIPYCFNQLEGYGKRMGNEYPTKDRSHKTKADQA